LPSHHRLALDSQLGALHIQATLELSAAWTILFGPSGSGKTSILRFLCGLLPTQNQLPTHRRNLAYAPQNPSIFPHLTVRQNVAFPVAVRNLKPQIDELLDVFFLTALADRDTELKGRRLGADDFVTKPIDFEMLATILEARLARVARNEVWSRAVALNERETDSLTWSARGKTSTEIATILGLSKRTVDFHIENACRKLNVATRIEAAVKAASGRLIDP